MILVDLDASIGIITSELLRILRVSRKEVGSFVDDDVYHPVSVTFVLNLQLHK